MTTLKNTLVASALLALTTILGQADDTFFQIRVESLPLPKEAWPGFRQRNTFPWAARLHPAPYVILDDVGEAYIGAESTSSAAPNDISATNIAIRAPN